MKPKNPISEISSHLWPDSDSPCIWMQAGLVEYKLCDRHLECDDCPFHAMMSGNDQILSAKSKQLKKIDIRRKDRAESVDDHKDIWQAYRQIFFDPHAYYGKGFWYIKPIDDRRAEMGLDGVAIMFMPTVKETILPQLNSTLTAGETCLWIITLCGTISLKTPISGKVISINNKVMETFSTHSRLQPSLWILEYQPQEWQNLLPTMFTSDEAANHLLNRWQAIVDKLDNELNFQHQKLGRTSQDGGEPMGSIEQMVGEEKYFAIISSFFLSG